MSPSGTANPPAECRPRSATTTSYGPQREIMEESHVVTSLDSCDRARPPPRIWVPDIGGLGRQRARRHRYRDQDRPDHALQRAGLVYGVIGRTHVAYFKMINEMGGVNGRKINLMSLDDGYSPPKTVEQVRRLVDRSRSLRFSPVRNVAELGDQALSQRQQDSANFRRRQRNRRSAIRNTFPGRSDLTRTIGRGAYLHHPYTSTKPDAKIGVLYQNDAIGKDYLTGLRDGLGADRAAMIVKEVSYEISDPSVDSQIWRYRHQPTRSFWPPSQGPGQAIRKI